LPYGSYARFMLLFLQSEAVKTRSRDIELGSSMRAWLATLGLSIGGKTYRLVSDQARRLSVCRLTFYMTHGKAEVIRNGAFVQGAIHFSQNADQPSLWQDRVVLDEEFYKALLDHPVPLSESALKAIGPRSLVIDIYIWLAYRLHALKKEIEIGWIALHAQFGGGAQALRQFRAYFLECLELALAAYPDARVTLGERGLILHPSRPAIGKV
jgi:hypothetical protein